MQPAEFTSLSSPSQPVAPPPETNMMFPNFDLAASPQPNQSSRSKGKEKASSNDHLTNPFNFSVASLSTSASVTRLIFSRNSIPLPPMVGTIEIGQCADGTENPSMDDLSVIFSEGQPLLATTASTGSHQETSRHFPSPPILLQSINQPTAIPQQSSMHHSSPWNSPVQMAPPAADTFCWRQPLETPSAPPLPPYVHQTTQHPAPPLNSCGSQWIDPRNAPPLPISRSDNDVQTLLGDPLQDPFAPPQASTSSAQTPQRQQAQNHDFRYLFQDPCQAQSRPQQSVPGPFASQPLSSMPPFTPPAPPITSSQPQAQAARRATRYHMAQPMISVEAPPPQSSSSMMPQASHPAHLLSQLQSPYHFQPPVPPKIPLNQGFPKERPLPNQGHLHGNSTPNQTPHAAQLPLPIPSPQPGPPTQSSIKPPQSLIHQYGAPPKMDSTTGHNSSTHTQARTISAGINPVGLYLPLFGLAAIFLYAFSSVGALLLAAFAVWYFNNMPFERK